MAPARKLLIISNTAHYQRNGGIVGWGPTVQEIDQLATLFAEIRHVACLHPERAPASALPYESGRVTLLPVAPAGGSSLASKVAILRLAPSYLRAAAAHLEWCDVVHVRCPSNVSLFAAVLLASRRQPGVRWIKYAGNWMPAPGTDPWSYRFQRWWLRRGFTRGWVTVNGEWPRQPAHVRTFINPCLGEAELAAGSAAASLKTLATPVRLVFAGFLHERKGAAQALRILSELRAEGIPAALDVVGDGPTRCALVESAKGLGLGEAVAFAGAVPRTELGAYLSKAHFLVLPSQASEGFPKVLSEGMAYGVVPLAGAVSAIPQTLARLGTGRALPPQDTAAFVRAIRDYLEDPETWRRESRAATIAAAEFSYARYLRDVEALLGS